MIEWAWMDIGAADGVHGPFASREDALANARDAGEEIVDLGHVQWIDPGDCVTTDFGSQYLGMEYDSIEGDGYWPERSFVCSDEEAAAKDLQTITQAWAREWFSSRCWRFDEVESFIDTITGEKATVEDVEEAGEEA